MLIFHVKELLFKNNFQQSFNLKVNISYFKFNLKMCRLIIF